MLREKKGEAVTLFKNIFSRRDIYPLCLGVGLWLGLFLSGPSVCGNGPFPPVGGHQMVAFTGAENRSDILRFHVRASSNSLQDQQVKNAVAAGILERYGSGWKGCTSSEELYSLLTRERSGIGETARRILCDRGFNEDVTVLLGKSLFPARLYGEDFYPAGEYEALIVVIGAGTGENWWCVLFPPLCFNVLPPPVTGVERGAATGGGPADKVAPRSEGHENSSRVSSVKKDTGTPDNREVKNEKKWRFWLAELLNKDRQVSSKEPTYR